MLKQLLVCPSCEKLGKRMVLGEIIGRGTVSVMRFHQGYTFITGENFIINCGNCGETIYHAQSINIGNGGIYRESSIQKTNGSRISSSQSSEGTFAQT